mmetsp:Transcript_5651/g.21286  ORF Transcript_5651/g.21286 Transcript_5651/m.21286 type:complete len:144 (-) Transcript_5651:1745-2176(-)
MTLDTSITSKSCPETASFLQKCLDSLISRRDLATTMLPPCRWLLASHQMCLFDKAEVNATNNQEKRPDFYIELKAKVDKELERHRDEDGHLRRVPQRKICCDCRETKRARDACVVENGPEYETCQYLIKAHNLCLMEEGFEKV